MEKGKNMGKKVQGKKSARYARDAQKAKDARGGKSAAAAGKGKDRNIGKVGKGGRRSAAGAKSETVRRKKDTAARRQERRAPELTPEQLAQRKRREARIRRHQAMLRARLIQKITGRTILFLIMFALISIVFSLCFFINLHHYEKPDISSFTVQIGPDANNAKKVAYTKLMKDGTLYVNMTEIAEYCGMIVTGDSSALRYTVDSAGADTVEFVIGTREVSVNGVAERLTAPAVAESDGLYVPFDFLATYMKGLQFTYDEEKGEISILRLYENEALTPETATETDAFQTLSFVVKSNAPLMGVDELSEFGDTSPIEFEADLSAFEQYMNPTNRDAYLTLVNAEHPLAEDYEPENLVEVTDIRRDGRAMQYMDATAEKALEAMFIELRAQGYTDLSVTVGYRDYVTQRYFFNQQVAEYMETMKDQALAEQAAAQVIARAGTSEYQTGLCADLHNMDEADITFGGTAPGQWLAENCWKFGFIVRYPINKTTVTGVSYQPWHFRFVGRYHAARIYESDLCLEEYVAKLEEEGYFDRSGA